MSLLNDNTSPEQNQVKIVILVSGNGSTMVSILKLLQGSTHVVCVGVIADRPAYALDRAKLFGVRAQLIEKERNESHFSKIDKECTLMQPDLIVLAGFLGILPASFVAKWEHKIINLHPSLLPKYGGKGMYGMHVHKAVIEAGETESGCTVHWVIAEVDAGEIIAQERVPVLSEDTPEDLSRRVQSIEKKLYSKTIVELSEKIYKERSLV